jgi:hypothetical protein
MDKRLFIMTDADNVSMYACIDTRTLSLSDHTLLFHKPALGCLNAILIGELSEGAGNSLAPSR